METGDALINLQNTKFDDAPETPFNSKSQTIEITQETPRRGLMTPSEFIKQINFTTEELQQILIKKQTGRKNKNEKLHEHEIISLVPETKAQRSIVDIEQPLFVVSPPQVQFQNYEAFQTYFVTLTFRNKDRVPRLIRVECKDSCYFSLVVGQGSKQQATQAGVQSKVAPGMSFQVKVKFTAEENTRDYSHKLICTTDREKFLIDVNAKGARGALDLPDSIEYEKPVPVKYRDSKTLLVRNIGNSKAGFTLKTDTNSNFTVSPSTGLLSSKEATQVTLDFRTDLPGHHTGYLYVEYDTGEICSVKLAATAADVNVRLEKSVLNFDKTFSGLQSRRTFRIFNNSDVLVNFKWCKYAEKQMDSSDNSKTCDELDTKKNLEIDGFEGLDLELSEQLASINRAFQARKIVTNRNDSHEFASKNFSIEPADGEIWPGGYLEASATFEPSSADIFQETAFLEVTGRKERLPIKLKGSGNAADLRFNCDEVDLGRLYLGSEHAFELVLDNYGDIIGNYEILNEYSDIFKFSPSSGELKASGCQAVYVSFKAKDLGQFEYIFETKVDGKYETLKLVMRGCVVGPTFHANTSALKFSNVSYGFEHFQKFQLVNTSDVPMCFELKVNSEELSVFPAGSTVLNSQQVVDIELGWKPKSLGVLKGASGGICELSVDVKDVGERILCIPVSGVSMIPKINLSEDTYDCGHCFIDHEKEVFIDLVNEPEDDKDRTESVWKKRCWTTWLWKSIRKINFSVYFSVRIFFRAK